MSHRPAEFIYWFRQGAPYINAHRGRTFVISIGGEATGDAGFASLVHDVALLNSLGIRVVLVAGARAQIEQRLRDRGLAIRYHQGFRVTDDAALGCVKEAVGSVRVEIEALLSMGLANSPMAGFRVQVASGNFVTARPLGVRDGVDYLHTGEVRRIDAAAISQRLAEGCVVLVTPLGYSPTGEVFNLVAEDVALAVAGSLQADKLLYLTDGDLCRDEAGGLIRELALAEAGALAGRLAQDDEARRMLEGAVRACGEGVQRVHLLNRGRDGCLLQELFTRDGAGTLVSGDHFETVRQATVDDIGGILELIEPLEREGVLVRRSREQLETGIGEFTVIERDGTVIASAALSRHPQEAMAELACFSIHPDYRGCHRGDTLLRQLERDAVRDGIRRLFVLTTRTAHWFQERGFVPGAIDDLPVARQRLYNLKRNSRVFVKTLAAA
ncbi:amino-acid N-acetyltransferase [Methylonatrum kenyense]|uniref:amino-acid N-acetyltransferase n=1 Tax=Methylonatrum kenyense TaxID=455253 RepID=UPI0020BEC52D|nr:amino-acid N-acetyltransferase [Methylonatrum kenyense]MCK8517048.1 amino-acid N-acetyltransferase [Methylonatrum kenyense]